MCVLIFASNSPPAYLRRTKLPILKILQSRERERESELSHTQIANDKILLSGYDYAVCVTDALLSLQSIHTFLCAFRLCFHIRARIMGTRAGVRAMTMTIGSGSHTELTILP